MTKKELLKKMENRTRKNKGKFKNWKEFWKAFYDVLALNLFLLDNLDNNK